MTNSVSRAIIATSVGGILITAATFFFFTPEEADPRDGLHITYRTQKFPSALFFQVGQGYHEKSEETGAEDARNFMTYFDYADEVNVSTYTIKNETGRTIESLAVRGDEDAILTFLSDDKGNRTLSRDEKTYSIHALPDSTARVSIISKGYTIFSPPVKFTLENRAVYIREIEPWNSDPYSEVAEKSPIIAFLLLTSGVLFWASIIVAGAIAFVTGRRPSSLAVVTTSESLGQSLALLNFIKVENPPKFKKAVEFAEKRYQKWSRPSDTMNTPEE